MVDARLLQVADDLRPCGGREQVGRSTEVEVELSADRIVERIGHFFVGRHFARRRVAEFLERFGVLVDVSFVGGDYLSERWARRVHVDLQNRVGGLVLLGLARGVAGSPVGVLG